MIVTICRCLTLCHLENSFIIELLSAGVGVAEHTAAVDHGLVVDDAGLVVDDGLALVTVPGVLALLPGQRAGHGGDEVEDCPGHDDVVVGGEEPRHHNSGHSSS